MLTKIVLESDQKIISEFPTAKQMKIFATNYSTSDWERLTRSREFLDIFTIDLNKAKQVADKILGKN